ncbi:hypothetical protein [Flavobacterium sp. XGLA_31]|uniref:hypothetical protein n=1 Tax=Flavobacterium sp. XGLA_31 TaxID=3447666 RepID=UPI003F385699
MNSYVKLEEVTALGDFILTSYTRDFDAIKSRFATMNNDFKDAFIAKLDFVKHLESSLMLTESQKGITASLYAEANQLNKELNYLSVYFEEAALNTAIVSGLKNDLLNGNIEGAILKIEGVKQFIGAHQSELVAQGMAADFADTLEAHRASLEDKNRIQNEMMDSRKQLTNKNVGHYEELKRMIKKIMRNGKLVFKGTVTQDEYTGLKLVQRMRAAKRNKEEGDGAV